MPSGGRRHGAGRPRKSLAQNLLDGNPGKRPVKVLKLSKTHKVLEALTPADYLPELARKVYLVLVEWLEEAGCLEAIFPGLIEEYALTKGRWLEAEAQVSRFGMLAKNGGGQPVVSPYVFASSEYLKAADRAWQKIFVVVKANCTEEFQTTPHADAMAQLLNLKG